MNIPEQQRHDSPKDLLLCHPKWMLLQLKRQLQNLFDAKASEGEIRYVQGKIAEIEDQQDHVL